MDREDIEIIGKEFNRLDDDAKIIIKVSIGLLQNKLMEMVNDLEKIKKGISLEEKKHDRK